MEAGGGSGKTAADGKIVSDATLRILVVDDDPVTHRLVSGLLRRQGYDVDTAGGGKEALQMLQMESYDLVIMDVEMPDLDGLEATRRMRQMLPASLCPIVGLTAHESAAERECCLAAGMDGVLRKPVRARELFGVVERWLSFPVAKRTDLKRGAGGTASPPVDLEAAVARCGGDREFASELLRDFVEDAGNRLERLKKLARDEAWLELARAAHQLKGAAGNLSADSLACLARRLEASAKRADSSAVDAILRDIEENFACVAAYLSGGEKGAGQQC